MTEPGRGYRFVASVAQSQTSEGFEPAITEREDAVAALAAERAPAVVPNGRSRAAGVGALAVLVALAGAAAWSIANRSAPETSADVIRRSIPFLEDPSRSPVGVQHIAISADGSRVANSGARRLWIRRLREEAPVIVEMNTNNPFFSPNGDWLGFFGSRLMKVPTAGGTPQLIAVTPERNAGATWGRDGNRFRDY